MIHSGYPCDSLESYVFFTLCPRGSPSGSVALLRPSCGPALETLTLITSLVTPSCTMGTCFQALTPPTTLLQIKPACAGTYTHIQCTPCSRLSASLSPMDFLSVVQSFGDQVSTGLCLLFCARAQRWIPIRQRSHYSSFPLYISQFSNTDTIFSSHYYFFF